MSVGFNSWISINQDGHMIHNSAWNQIVGIFVGFGWWIARSTHGWVFAAFCSNVFNFTLFIGNFMRVCNFWGVSLFHGSSLGDLLTIHHVSVYGVVCRSLPPCNAYLYGFLSSWSYPLFSSFCSFSLSCFNPSWNSSKIYSISPPLCDWHLSQWHCSPSTLFNGKRVSLQYPEMKHTKDGGWLVCIPSQLLLLYVWLPGIRSKCHCNSCIPASLNVLVTMATTNRVVLNRSIKAKPRVSVLACVYQMLSWTDAPLKWLKFMTTREVPCCVDARPCSSYLLLNSENRLPLVSPTRGPSGWISVEALAGTLKPWMNHFLLSNLSKWYWWI